MSNYQRLISYIYTYEGGIRGKNIGFAKLETRGSQCRITVNVKKIFVGGNPVGVYLLSGQDEVKIGTLFARNGAGEFRTMVNSADVENSGHSLEEFYGLSVHDVESAWRSYTTIWEDAVAHAAEVELADVTSEKVAMKHDNTAKVQSALQTEEKEQELLPISREIEEQVEKEAVLQEESVCEATDRKQAETGSRVYDAEQGKIVHLSSEIPKVSRNTAQTAEGRAFTSGLREKIVSQIRQNEAAVPDEKAWRDPALPDAADAEAVKKEEVNADETNRDGVMAPEVNPAEFSSSEVSSSEVNSTEANSSEVNSTEVNSSEADLPEAEPEELKPVAEIIRGADIQEADKTEGGTGIFAQSAAQETLPIRQSAVETVKRRMPVWRMPEPEPVNGSDPVTEEPLQEMEIPKAETALPQQEDAGEDEAIQGLDSTVTSEVEYIAPGLAKTNRQPEFQPNNAAPGMSGPAVHSSGMLLQESSGPSAAGAAASGSDADNAEGTEPDAAGADKAESDAAVPGAGCPAADQARADAGNAADAAGADAVGPDEAKPASPGSDAAEPEPAEPNSAEPDSAEPDPAKPDPAKPDPPEPDPAGADAAAKPDESEPGAAAPNAGSSDEDVTG